MCTKRYLSQHDLAILTRFAHASDPGGAPGAARPLAELVESAILLPDPLPGQACPPRHVSLGAAVRYRIDGAREPASIVIACPQDANAMLARVSVLAPLALGLLGHAEGCTVGIDLPHRRRVRVDILDVQPAR